MNLEELVKALGLDNEESKEKVAILKKEYNAQQKEIKKLTDANTELTANVEAGKVVAERLNSVVTAFGLDIEAKDFDENIENAKESIIKAAGGGTTPEEIKELKLSKTKAERENKKYVMTHGEAANNEDGGIGTHNPYAWWNDSYQDGDTRGDLEYLGTAESPRYNPWTENGTRGGDVLRGKANWYRGQRG